MPSLRRHMYERVWYTVYKVVSGWRVSPFDEARRKTDTEVPESLHLICVIRCVLDVVGRARGRIDFTVPIRAI